MFEPGPKLDWRYCATVIKDYILDAIGNHLEKCRNMSSYLYVMYKQYITTYWEMQTSRFAYSYVA